MSFFPPIASSGEELLVKPNLLFGAVPGRAITTHPEIVRSVVAHIQGLGVSVGVGDSPGGRTSPDRLEKIFNECGLTEGLRGLDVEMRFLDGSVVALPVPGGRMPEVRVSSMVSSFDRIVNVAKLKTHGLMGLTLAVKNLFGLVVGLEKAQYHLRMPQRHDFAEMLVDVATAFPDTFSVIDGVVGMEGEGPSRGTPRRIGVVCASDNPFALDLVVASALGFDPTVVPTLEVSLRRGLTPPMDGIEVVGDGQGALAAVDFTGAPSSRRVPPFLLRIARRRATARPVIMKERCEQCGICIENCPPACISTDASGFPVIDDEACIRCYCCDELCPYGACRTVEPYIARLFRLGTAGR